MGKDYLSILMEWKPEGDFTEADLWDAIAESHGVDVSEISDRDLTEFIQRLECENAERYDRLTVSRWGEVAGHLNGQNLQGSETIRLPTESITRER